jgi:AraC-like DNA-binding protein
MPPDDRLDAFFACWTRREAFVKARGQGLAIPLDSFDVSLVHGASSKVIETPDGGACWLSDLPRIKGHAAAVALVGPPLALACWRWTPQPFTNRPLVSPTVRLTLEFLHDHYTERIAWRDVAASVRRNGAYLARRFRRETGATVRQYLSDLRVQRAAQLIAGGDKVEFVMLSVGYHSKRTFYAHFRTAFGVTPGVYRLNRTVDAHRLPETARRIPLIS